MLRGHGVNVMEFRDFLVNETSTSLQRVLGRRSEQSLQGLAALRKAFGDAMANLESAVGAVHEPHDAEMSALVERLTTAMAACAQVAGNRARAEAEEKVAAAESKRAEAEKMYVGALKSKTDLTASLSELRGQVDALQTEVQSERGKAAKATTELAQVHSARAQTETAVQNAEMARRQHEHARKALERELLDTRAALDRARAESASVAERFTSAAAERASLEAAANEARSRLKSTETQRDALAAQVEKSVTNGERLEQLSREVENVRRELQGKLEAATARETFLRERLTGAEGALKQVRVDEEARARAAAQAPRATGPSLEYEQLIEIYQELESHTSITGVLTALTQGLSSQFARVALFSVSGNALQGTYQVGFDINKDIAKIVIPLTMESVLARAFASGHIETAVPDDQTSGGGVPFGGPSGWYLAMPVVLQQETVAVIYADDGQKRSPGADLQKWGVTFAELLRRHAIPVLTKLSADLQAWSALRDYAMLLLDEVEYVYGSDAGSGMQNAELVERLTENLRCAQEAYGRRMASAAARDAGTDFFEDRLNTVLDAKGATPFGRHLAVAAAAVMKTDHPAEPAARPREAQAS